MKEKNSEIIYQFYPAVIMFKSGKTNEFNISARSNDEAEELLQIKASRRKCVTGTFLEYKD